MVTYVDNATLKRDKNHRIYLAIAADKWPLFRQHDMAANPHPGVTPVELPPSPFSLAELRSELRPRAQAATERMQATLADAICIEAVRGYWASLTKAFPLREPPHERRTLSEPLAAAAWRLGEVVAPLPVSEAAYHLSFLYTGLLPPEWRATDSGESRHQFRPRFQEPNRVPHQSRNDRNMAGGRFAPDHFRHESFEGSIMTLLEQALRLGRCALSEQSFADALTSSAPHLHKQVGALSQEASFCAVVRRAIQARFHRLCV